MTRKSALAFTGTPGPLRSITAAPGALPVLPYLTRSRVSICLTAPDRSTRWRIGQWSAIKFGKDLHDAGVLQITAPLNVGWITRATADSSFDAVENWERYSFDIWIDGTLEWSGPILRRDFAPGAALHVAPMVTFTAETFTQHFPSRRSNATTNKADVSYNDQADDIIRQAMRNANGSVSATGYPVGVSRSDFGSGWAVSVQADAGLASTIQIGEQEGGNTWGFMLHVAEKGDCFIWADEATAAAWQFRVDSPYIENDRSADIFLLPPSGTVTGYKLGRTTEDLVNVFAVKGDGEGTGQLKTWYSDTPSVTPRGVYEGQVTLPSAATNAHTDAEGDTILDRYANPQDTIEVGIRDTARARFVFHASAASGEYGMRDVISVAVPQAATIFTASVVGWELSQQGNGPFVPTAKLGDFRPSVGKQAALYAGWIGRNGGGSRWRNRGG